MEVLFGSKIHIPHPCSGKLSVSSGLLLVILGETMQTGSAGGTEDYRNGTEKSNTGRRHQGRIPDHINPVHVAEMHKHVLGQQVGKQNWPK